ncbi:hypothetical protein F9230_05185 [Acinetobacter johnsonii]|uniref:hypothetical protein n=1 Tax=Acinetobacter TaxID=469 RepID=UPI00124FC137|nr:MULTISPECIES: hypothetical protein [Acinetobacter]UJA03799.1 hypothetical protein F9230_05185 [Acinetobacter johnsonii]
MIKVRNTKTNEERMLNKVLGDEVTLAKAQEHAKYYDLDNHHFIPNYLNNTKTISSFYEAEDLTVFWEEIV